MGKTMKKVHAKLYLTLLLAALLTAAGCAINPATGKRQLSLIGESQEVAMGLEADGAIVAQMGLYGGDDLQDYVQGIGSKMAAVSERPQLDWTFRVVNDGAVNAFALPGGYIYITRGIMTHLNSEAELATVVGHEIGHVTARHSVNQMSKAQLAQMGLGVGVALSPELAQFGQYAEMGLGLMFLKFGRDDERQSDDLGLRYMVKAGYDPRPSPKVFDMLDDVSRASGGDRLPGWMSTHPAPENREAFLESRVSAMDQDFSQAKIGTQEYLAHLDGMVYGVDPREGYFKEQGFYHPELEFRFEFPSGWKTANGREAVLASTEANDAIIRLTMSSKSTPQAGLDEFLGQEGVEAGANWRSNVNRYSVASRNFGAVTQQGNVRGVVVYLEHGDNVYQLMGYTFESKWAEHGSKIETSLASFDRLTDRDALAVEPARIKIVDVRESMTLEQFAQRYDASVSTKKLALINQIEVTDRLEAGRPYKTVQGGRRP
jgi:predicted Zn-dependent protease